MFHLSVYNTYFRVNTIVTSPSPCFFSVIYVAQVSFASMLKGLIEYLIYLLFSSGRDVFIQVEKVYQDIPFLERRAIWRVLKLFHFFCFPRHRASGPVPAVIRNAGEKLTRSHTPPQKKTKTKLEETRVVKGSPPRFSGVRFNSPFPPPLP